MNKEVKKRRRKISFQKVFNLTSFTFILACCIFYGSRFIMLYLDNNKADDVKVIADNIKDSNEQNEHFKNINGDYYFEGNEVNNYLEYSNLIWRIIRINSDKTITLVLDNSITLLAAGQKKDFTSSYLNEWLNDQNKDYTGILENSLNNAKNYLTYTKTCRDTIKDTKNITCKNLTEDIFITVPSLNDYVNTGSSESFMNNSEYFYLLNNDGDKYFWYIDSDGNPKTTNGTDIIGVKPVITIKSTTMLKSGTGTKDDPYFIEEKRGLFGSYIKLGNDIWRVYNIDGDNLKLSLNNYLSINNSDVRYKYSNNGYYHNDTVGGSLAYYLKNTYLSSLPYQDKINEIKYSNGLYSNTTDFDYKKVLNTQVDTKVALLSIGDIFLNSEVTNYYTSTGISKDSNLMYIMRNDFKIYTNNATTNLKVIPVISITKTEFTNGDGSIDNPFEV